jgi:hypothetical protein
MNVGAFTPCPVAHGGSAMAVLGSALMVVERRQGSRGRQRHTMYAAASAVMAHGKP